MWNAGIGQYYRSEQNVSLFIFFCCISTKSCWRNTKHHLLMLNNNPFLVDPVVWPHFPMLFLFSRKSQVRLFSLFIPGWIEWVHIDNNSFEGEILWAPVQTHHALDAMDQWGVYTQYALWLRGEARRVALEILNNWGSGGARNKRAGGVFH